jgi:hypothetical protein
VPPSDVDLVENLLKFAFTLFFQKYVPRIVPVDPCHTIAPRTKAPLCGCSSSQAIHFGSMTIQKQDLLKRRSLSQKPTVVLPSFTPGEEIMSTIQFASQSKGR